MVASLSPSVVRLFELAGWHSGRSVPVRIEIPDRHPACEVLASYGGLHVRPQEDSGLECGTSDVEFNAPHKGSDVAKWEALLETELVSVAEVGAAHSVLCVALDGACYGSSYIHDAFYFEGENFGVAVEGLLLGKMARPMLHPKQSQVSMYGRQYSAGDPDVFDWRACRPDKSLERTRDR
jgi:hypothetical protein